MRRIEMERIEMDRVEMNLIFMDPVSIVLGPQRFANSDFSDMKLGAEQVTNGDFSSATGWNLVSGWSIDTGLGTLIHDGTAKSNTTQSGFTAYQAIKTEIITDSNAQTSNKALVRETFLQNKWNLSDDASAIDVSWECNAGTDPTIFSIRDTEVNGSSRVFSSISIKGVTLTGWTELGTRTATEHMCFNHETEKIQIVSGGAEMGITQDLSDGDTYGSELQDNSDLSGTGGSFIGTGSGSGDIADDWLLFVHAGDTASGSKTAEDAQVITGDSIATGAVFFQNNSVGIVSGTLYKATINIIAITGSTNWRVSKTNGSAVQFIDTISSEGTYTQYFIANTTDSVTNYLDIVNTGDTFTIAEASIKEVTTAEPVFEPGEYYYAGTIETVTSGSLKLATPSDGTLTTFTTAGSKAGVVTITDPNVRFEANGACDVVADAITLYKVE